MDETNIYISDAEMLRLNILELAVEIGLARNMGSSEIVILADEFLEFVED